MDEQTRQSVIKVLIEGGYIEPSQNPGHYRLLKPLPEQLTTADPAKTGHLIIPIQFDEPLTMVSVDVPFKFEEPTDQELREMCKARLGELRVGDATQAPQATEIGFGGDCLKPDWDSASHVHDWRWYVTDDLRRLWPQFSDEQRRAIACAFEEVAKAEVW